MNFAVAYYFFPEGEKERASELEELIRSRYGNAEILPQGLKSLETITECSLFHTRSQPLACLGLVCPINDECDLPDLIKAWEAMVESLIDVFILGRTYAVAGGGAPEKIIEALQVKLACEPTSGTYAELNYGLWRGVRQGWGWVYGLAICAFPAATAELLLEKFPLLEMKWLRGQLIWRLSCDQRKTIVSEREELERELSGVLFSTLMPATRSEQIEVLEEDMNTLSRGYGVLTANHRLLVEGRNRLRDQIATMKKELQAGDMRLDLASSEFVLGTISDEVERINELVNTLRDARQDYQAGMEVVEGKVEMLLSRENLQLQQRVMEVMELGNAMQRQSLTLQVSASLIEFIILAYYGLNLWKYLDPNGYHAVPGWGQALLVALFAGDVVYLTHLVAETIQGHKGLSFKTGVAVAALITILALFVGGKYLFKGH